jgi:hypothetical protein
MTVQELIDRLGELDLEAELRFVYQENYPLQDDIAGVWEPEGPTCINCEAVLDSRGEDGWYCWGCKQTYEKDEVEQPEEGNLAYIVSGGQNYKQPYGPKAAFAGRS